MRCGHFFDPRSIIFSNLEFAGQNLSFLRVTLSFLPHNRGFIGSGGHVSGSQDLGGRILDFAKTFY